MLITSGVLCNSVILRAVNNMGCNTRWIIEEDFIHTKGFTNLGTINGEISIVPFLVSLPLYVILDCLGITIYA